MHVLVADDDPASRCLMETTVTKWGYTVVACSDGSQAWKVLSGRNPPEIAILNWMMPGPVGPELCRMVRQSPELASLYIVLLTARGGSDDVIAGLDAGADDYVSKPFDSDELHARIRVGQRAVDLHRRRLERETASYVVQLEQVLAELQLSRRRIVVAQEEARKALAEELHGPVQTRMYMLYVKLGEIQAIIGSSPREAEAELGEAATELDAIRENEIRSVSHRLHPGIIDIALGTGIRSLCDRFERQIAVNLEIGQDIAEREPAGSSTIPYDVRLGLYRVAEEALSNVVRHSDATSVALRLQLDEGSGHIRLTVQDNGVGFVASSSRRGLGTLSMEDYLGALCGWFKLETAPGEGTRITASVPLETGALDSAAEQKVD